MRYEIARGLEADVMDRRLHNTLALLEAGGIGCDTWQYWAELLASPSSNRRLCEAVEAKLARAIPEHLRQPNGQFLTPHFDPCLVLPWVKGRPQMSFEGRRDAAARFVYVAKYGDPLSEERVVRHRCNNERCINPDHLIAGYRADNERDKWMERIVADCDYGGPGGLA